MTSVSVLGGAAMDREVVIPYAGRDENSDLADAKTTERVAAWAVLASVATEPGFSNQEPIQIDAG